MTVLHNITSAAVLLVCVALWQVRQVDSRKHHTAVLSQGAQCAGCTFGLGIVQELSQYYNESITEALDRVCRLFSDPSYRFACDNVIKFIAPLIIAFGGKQFPPDEICMHLRICNATPSSEPVCRLFPLPEVEPVQQRLLVGKLIMQKFLTKAGQSEMLPFCEWPGVKFFCALAENFYNNQLPLIDRDGDGFSTFETFRGSSWRGKDCDDLNPNFHPGARPINSDRVLDSNCNGIYGLDASGQPYEDLLCKDSDQRGVVLLGDSAGAHFHIPDQWLYPPDLTEDNLSHLPFVIENEFDWPMLSAATGYENITWSIAGGSVDSAYSRLRNRNLCNHRDYQNLGVNGADSHDAINNFNSSFRRNQTSDYPVFLVYEFVGNDVCNKFEDTIAHMTTTDQMRENVRKILSEFEVRLPRGSHVLMTGLVDGRVLYDNLYSRFYPLGRLNKNIRYSDFYDFLKCLGVNPCNGWMSTNATLRDYTSQRAWELSQVIKETVEKSQRNFFNFEVSYVDCPLNQILLDWEMKYGPDRVWELIETVDGFHPNQMANELFAEYMWTYLETHHPEYLGPINPNNKKIRHIFPDQGGH